VLAECFNSSKYYSMDVYPALFAGRVKTLIRLDLVADPAFLRGTKILFLRQLLRGKEHNPEISRNGLVLLTLEIFTFFFTYDSNIEESKIDSEDRI
jgi:hypothetical protein